MMMEPAGTKSEGDFNAAGVGQADAADGLNAGADDAFDAEVKIMPAASGLFGDEEEVCGVCLEVPGEGSFVELWCCGNVLCVEDAQQIGKCPFCRQEPLVWNILK